MSNTCLLVSALHGKAVIQHVMRGETTLIDYERRLLDQVLTSPDLSPALMCWCLKQKSVAQILTRDMSGVLETIRKVIKWKKALCSLFVARLSCSISYHVYHQVVFMVIFYDCILCRFLRTFQKNSFILQYWSVL